VVDSQEGVDRVLKVRGEESKKDVDGRLLETKLSE
jgi:hypothetical protein